MHTARMMDGLCDPRAFTQSTDGKAGAGVVLSPAMAGDGFEAGGVYALRLRGQRGDEPRAIARAIDQAGRVELRSDDGQTIERGRIIEAARAVARFSDL